MNKKLLTVLLALLVVGIGFQYFQKKNVPKSPNAEVVKEFKASLTIEDKIFDISGYIGRTALEATKGVADISATGSGANTFVTEINSRKADTKKREFWELVVNGKSAEVGAGSYTIQNGDRLEWRLSSY